MSKKTSPHLHSSHSLPIQQVVDYLSPEIKFFLRLSLLNAFSPEKFHNIWLQASLSLQDVFHFYQAKLYNCAEFKIKLMRKRIITFQHNDPFVQSGRDSGFCFFELFAIVQY